MLFGVRRLAFALHRAYRIILYISDLSNIADFAGILGSGESVLGPPRPLQTKLINGWATLVALRQT